MVTHSTDLCVERLHPPLRVRSWRGKPLGRLCAVYRGTRQAGYSYGLLAYHRSDGLVSWLGIPLREFAYDRPGTLRWNVPDEFLAAVPDVDLSKLPTAAHLEQEGGEAVLACIRERLQAGRSTAGDRPRGPVRAPVFDPEGTTIYAEEGFNALVAAAVCCS